MSDTVIIDKNSDKYKVLLKFVNSILTNVGKDNIKDLTEFVDIDREDIIKDENKTSLVDMQKELFKHFDKKKCGYYRKTDALVLNCLRGMVKETEKTLHNTTICECNKRPLFTEEPDNAEVKRIIDILFRSTFEEGLSLVDPENFVYESKSEYKEIQFQQKHKCALLKILMDSHKIYTINNYKFNVPLSIQKRTADYLELSCALIQWFKENYELTEDKKNYVKLNDLYSDFKMSEYYDNLTKIEKRKHNYKYFIGYFSTNIISKKYYKERYTELRNILMYWKKIDNMQEFD